MMPYQKSEANPGNRLLLNEGESVDQYAVLGNPINHSLSPLIHRLFSEQTQQPLLYSAILVPLHHLRDVLNQFRAEKGKGVNITSPFKQEAVHLVDSLTERATLAQAINTIRFNEDGSCMGDNTDGIGLIRDLTRNQRISLSGKKLLILGAGGAVRGIVAPLLNEKPELLMIANRTQSKAEALVTQFIPFGNIAACSLSSIKNHPFDLIINTISGELPTLSNDLRNSNTFCYDLRYAHENTDFLRWAEQQDIHSYCDGLGMLVEQAAESFYFWRGILPETKPVIDSILDSR